MSLVPIFGGRSYNGMTALQILQELSLTTSLQLCLDAGDAASYTSGQKWLDRSGNGYDFNRGVAGTSSVTPTGTANGTFSAATSIVGVAIGTANASRMVVVCLSYRNATDPASVTIGGIVATQLAVAGEAVDTRTVAIWAAMVPTGTTATISWTNSASGGYSVFSVPGVGAVTASDTLSDITLSLSGTIDIPANGGMIALCIGEDAAAVAWTGATEYSDFSVGNQRHSAAARTTVAAETGHTVTPASSTSNGAMVAVSWAPTAAGFTNEPTFNGVAGALSSLNYFSFDVDFLEYDSANEASMNNIHKDNAAFTLATMVYPAGSAGNNLIGDSDNNQTNVGFIWSINSSTGAGTMNVSKGSAGYARQITAAGLGATNAAWQFIALSVGEAANSAFWHRNGVNLTAQAASYTSPSSAAATHRLRLGSQGPSAHLPAGARMAIAIAWSRALSTGEVSSVFSALRSRWSL